MLVFDERGKPEYPGKTSHGRVENQQTQSTYDTGRVRKSNPGHIGERQVLSPLGQPCHHCFHTHARTYCIMNETFSKLHEAKLSAVLQISQSLYSKQVRVFETNSL